MLPELFKSDKIWANAIHTHKWMLDPTLKVCDPVLYCLMEIGVINWFDNDKRTGPIAKSECFLASMVARVTKRVYHWGQRGSYLAGTLRVC